MLCRHLPRRHWQSDLQDLSCGQLLLVQLLGACYLSRWQLLSNWYEVCQRVLVSQRHLQQRHRPAARRELHELHSWLLLRIPRPHGSNRCLRGWLLLWRRQLGGYSLRHWQVLVVPSGLCRRQLCGDVEHDAVPVVRQWSVLGRHMCSRDQHHDERHLSARSLLSSRQYGPSALSSGNQLVIDRLDRGGRLSTM